ncbi:hypothetical protein PUN28_013980 [Cardiocondyla obscurior]|uniref:Uncharacterized protein n=1 Tax=Cardiocondyla obscurior TaxID=286306 RepID=A0AAW2F867_9HYME
MQQFGGNDGTDPPEAGHFQLIIFRPGGDVAKKGLKQKKEISNSQQSSRSSCRPKQKKPPTATWHADILRESNDKYDDDLTKATYENVNTPDRQTHTSAHTTIRTANAMNFMLTITDQGHGSENSEATASAPSSEN